MVVAARAGELELAVQARRLEPVPRCRVVVVQAILKGDRGELAVELMTEVGVDVIVPWAAERCVAKWPSGASGRPGPSGPSSGGADRAPDRADRADKALGRLRSTAREAAKQSRRARFPEVTEQADLADVAARVSGAQLSMLLDPAAERRLVDLELPPAGDIVLIVGPEGGISEAETARLVQAGAVPARLGPSVLRASTAGAIAAALVLNTAGRWP